MCEGLVVSKHMQLMTLNKVTEVHNIQVDGQELTVESTVVCPAGFSVLEK